MAQTLYWLNCHVFKSLHFKFSAHFLYRFLYQKVSSSGIAIQTYLLILRVVEDRIPASNMATDGIHMHCDPFLYESQSSVQLLASFKWNVSFASPFLTRRSYS
jgi:hypothetical protein